MGKQKGRKSNGRISQALKRGKRKRGTDRADEMPGVDVGPLWSGQISESCARHWERTKQRDSTSPLTIKSMETLVVQEVARYQAICSLREKLQRLCGKGSATCKYPSLAFERWLYSAKSSEESRLTCDPVVPSVSKKPDKVLLGDLLKVGFTREGAIQICKEMIREAKSVVSKLRGGNGPTDSRRGKFCVWTKTVDQGYELGVHALKEVCISVPKDMMDKLRLLYRADEQFFYSDVFRVMLRYKAIGGAGFQAGLPSKAFDTLQNVFGVQMELFASPLNCYFGSYCSAFPDVDRRFGSCGNFFDFLEEGLEGSFEANPPFAPGLMLKMTARMERVLARSQAALSFAVVVPAWKDTDSWKALDGSAFKRAVLMVSKDKHVWRQTSAGDASTKAFVARRVPCDTAIFFLQNEEGHHTWDPNASNLSLLEKAIILES